LNMRNRSKGQQIFLIILVVFLSLGLILPSFGALLAALF
jgi:hypothetical protein